MHSGPSSSWLSRHARLAVLGLALALPSLASAQAATIPGFNLERLELNPSGVGSLLLDTPLLLPEGGFRFQAVGHYEHTPLIVLRNDERVGAAIRDRFTLHATGAVAVKKWLELGLQVPIILHQDSNDLTVANLQSPAAAGLGSPVVTGRLSLWSSRGTGVINPGQASDVDVAVQVGIGINVGSEAALARDPSLGVQPKLLIGKQVGDFMLSGEASSLIRQAQAFGLDELGSQLNFGASVAYVNHPLGAELTFRSTVPLTHATPSAEVLGGLRYRFSPFIEGFALAAFGLGSLPGTPSCRGILGIAYGSSDGVAKPELAPTVPPVDTTPGATAATPPPTVPPPCEPGRTHTPAQCPELDDDGDGIPNGQDQCPLDKGIAARQGCPEPDDDLDGTPDSVDRCPHEPGPPQTFGCPVLDRDKDGVPDGQDACPDEPGSPEARGCPIRDSDGDGIPDHQDNCPREPGPASNQGCPVKEKQLVVITKEKLAIKDKVYFAFDKAAVLPRSYPMLDQIAKILQEHPEIPAISIEGHTDNVGSDAYNRKLSQARAESVQEYLNGKGVSPQRVVAKGFGPDRPAASNDTADGREQNRRVEFNILDSLPRETGAQPTAPQTPGGVNR